MLVARVTFFAECFVIWGGGGCFAMAGGLFGVCEDIRKLAVLSILGYFIYMFGLSLSVDTCVRSLCSLADRALDGSGCERPNTRSLKCMGVVETGGMHWL